MEQLFSLILRLAGQIHTKLTEGGSIYLRENNRGMYLCIFQHRDSLERHFCTRVIYRRDRQRNEDLVGVESGVMVTEIFDLKLLNRLDDLVRDNVHSVGNARHRLDRIKQSCARCAEKRACLTCNNLSVVKLDRNCGSAGFLGLAYSGANSFSIPFNRGGDLL